MAMRTPGAYSRLLQAIVRTMATIKDSGQRESFAGGAVRDIQDDKPRYELIPPAPLYRLAMHYAGGAAKYAPWNWAKGMPLSRALASLERHLQQYKEGDTEEDHLAAVAWNAFALMHYETYPHLYEQYYDLPDWEATTIEEALHLDG
jgi:hypothetical protein